MRGISKKYLILGVLLLLVSIGCVEETGQTTPSKEMSPTEIVEKYAKAHKYQNFEEMYSLMSTEYRNSYPEPNFRALIEAPRMAMEQQGTPIKSIKVTGEEISGNSATVEFMYELSGIGFTYDIETVDLIKESDGWRIVHHNYML